MKRYTVQRCGDGWNVVIDQRRVLYAGSWYMADKAAGALNESANWNRHQRAVLDELYAEAGVTR